MFSKIFQNKIKICIQHQLMNPDRTKNQTAVRQRRHYLHSSFQIANQIKNSKYLIGKSIL